jgi:hypothetical protein
MANHIKNTGNGALALQITNPARESGLVEEHPDGDYAQLADVRVAAVDDTILVVHEEVPMEHRAELVATCIRDAESIYQITHDSVTPAGGGCKLHLPAASESGFAEGDIAPVRTADRMLVITDESRRAIRRAEELIAIREEQQSP